MGFEPGLARKAGSDGSTKIWPLPEPLLPYFKTPKTSIVFLTKRVEQVKAEVAGHWLWVSW